MPSIKGIWDHYMGYDKPKPPPITTTAASALLVAYTVLYVLPFYLSSKTRPSRTLSRDAPSVIRARVTSVSLTCVVCSVSTYLLLTSKGKATNLAAVHSLGYWPLGLAETGKSLLLTMMLFVGPLFEYFVVNEGWRDWVALRPFSELFSHDWIAWRNYVAGPFTEEVLFRSSSVSLMLLAHTEVAKTILLSPVIFGLAHLHHFYEFRITHPSVSFSAAALRSLLQFSYTSLFGAFATFVFLRTGSLLAIFVVHAFCNAMGLPRFWGRVQPDSDIEEQKGKPPIVWTVIYYPLLFVGAFLFYTYLGVLTKSDNELVPIKI